MNRPLISIIVPIYNVEQWLPRCIDSLLTQTYQNIEIILCDDGSPDGCARICDEYAGRDSRIVVIHKPNGGLSDARNAAIKQAKGDYFTFIDSDDYVTEDYVEVLYGLCEKYNTKMSVADWCVFPIGQEPVLNNGSLIEIKFSKMDGLEDMFNQSHFDNSACVKLYHRSLFESIEYPKGFVFEDLMTTFKIMLKCDDGVAYSNKQIYYYMFRPDSIEGSVFSEKKRQSVHEVFRIMDSYSNELMPIADAVKSKLSSFSFHLLLKLPDNCEDSRFFQDYIKRVRWNVVKNSKTRMKNRLACFLSYFGFPTVKAMFRFVDRRKKQSV